jgi:hypothetical protein
MMKNKRGMLGLVLILVGIIGLMAFVYGVSLGWNLTAALTGSGGYIERPVFKYVKCEAMSGLKYSEPSILSKSGEWIYPPSVSSSYSIKGTTPNKYPDNTISRRVVYSVCNSQINSVSNCQIYEQIISADNFYYEINGIAGNQRVFIKYQTRGLFSWGDKDGATYQIGVVPYGLREYDVLSGSSNPITPNDCTISSTHDSWVDRFISSDSSKVNSQISKNVNQRTLQPEEVRWYVSGYVTSAAPSFTLKYKNQDAWCRTTGTSAEIYKINTIQVGSGNYKVASPDWSDYLGSERCCPGQTRGDEVCQPDFTYKQITGNQCGVFKSCGSPNWIPYSEGQIIKYYCDNGYCKQDIKAVECASDYDCKDSNQICDLNQFKCVEANVNLKGQKIETTPDNLQDCQAKGGTWKTKTTTKGNPILSSLTFGILGGKEIVVIEYCDLSRPNYLLWMFILVILLIGGYFAWPYILGYLNIGIAWIKTNPFIAILIILAILFFGGIILI